MAYTITVCKLNALFPDGSSQAYGTPYDLLVGDIPKVGFGELLILDIKVTSTSAAFATGQRFIFNPCLFAPTIGNINYPLGVGWLIEIVNAGTSTVSASLVTGILQSDITQRNVGLLNLGLPTATTMQFSFVFYAGQDVADYIRTVPRSNIFTLQSTGSSPMLFDNSPNVIWQRGTGFLEFVMYECGANLPPTTATYPDPYIRNPSTAYQKQNSYAITAAFLDNNVGSTQAWSGGSLTQNNLESVENFINGNKFLSFNRLSDPIYNNAIDQNFSVLLDEDLIIINTENNVAARLPAPTFIPHYVICRLWRVDADSLQSAQPFIVEYDIKGAKISTNATAYPNSLDIDPIFSTPSVLTLGNPTNIAFKINGNHLIPNAQYRLWIGMYDSVSRNVSTHISPTMRARSISVPTLTITGNTKLYDYQYPNYNDVTVSEYERFKPEITLDASTYTGGFTGVGSFLQHLQRVSLSLSDGTRSFGSAAEYDFVAGVSNTTPAMTLDIAGANYTFGAELRAPNNAASNLANVLTVAYAIDFRIPQANGSFDLITFKTQQLIRRRAQNATRLLITRFLDYSEFLVSNITPIDTFCIGVSKYVVEAELDAVPLDATLQAYAIFGTQNGNERIVEEESYSSVYLTQLAAPQLSNVNATFGIDKKAYFVLDISRFPSNAVFTAVGINAVDF